MNLEQNLNELLADLNVFYRKLQNYHWNAQGKDFFRTHEKLEELYNEVKSLLKSSPTFLNENPSLQENLKMCEEMVGMLPVKIDKINRGEEI